MFRFFSYVRFLSKASNQHGVHSPFVYAFVTKGLYKKQALKGSIATKALYKSIRYFNPITIKSNSGNSLISDLEINNTPNKQWNLYILDKVSVKANCFNRPETRFNHSYVFILSPYKNKNVGLQWQNIKSLKEVSVTIDLYYCAFVFFRREQVKQDFKIRY